MATGNLVNGEIELAWLDSLASIGDSLNTLEDKEFKKAIKKLQKESNNIKKILIYPKKSKAMNLAFDVTPAKYITGLITEKGVCEASKEGLRKLFK